MLNVSFSKFIKNMSYTIYSNLISLVISTVVILVIPKLIGIEDYGYWQLYMFYSSYYGFFHLGWNDGIYLKYGGENYNSLNKNLFFSQFIELLVLQILVASAMWISADFLVNDFNKEFIIKMVSIAMVVVNTRLMLLYVLQATNRIKEYAWLTMLDRIIYIALVLIFLYVGFRDFKVMIISDLLAKFISLLAAMFCCNEIVFNKINYFRFTVSEALDNINIGIKLMISNFASMLIIGIVRFGIEIAWDVQTFGKVSLTLSVSNTMMIFINAIGIVLFPILRRTDYQKLTHLYEIMREVLMILLLGILIIYWPLKNIISLWLPQYSDSLNYMSLIFPIFIYEGKMSLLINTYMKTLRKEKKMLKINLFSMGLSLILTCISVVIFKNLELAIISIVFLLAIRSSISEIYISKVLNFKVKKNIVLETILVVIFIITGWYINSWLTVVLYVFVYFIYILIRKKEIYKTLESLKQYF